ncbi:hypothetical protein CYMTET_38016 [Cymbomonas tetramitiformis]|uniref:AAA+ ATPase domain-containing protein n=1 Tax=Cymbomonas tetramitiformis TaxID=36881 RepID=A0AAE0F701_9CHLO|nr:hypothetical protein CYMTET_38016 [Cymbomonas tetramitiformis]
MPGMQRKVLSMEDVPEEEKFSTHKPLVLSANRSSVNRCPRARFQLPPRAKSCPLRMVEEAASEGNAKTPMLQEDRTRPLPPTQNQAWEEAAALTRFVPKVMAPFETSNGLTPRAVQIERKKRLFMQQDINLLLQETQIDLRRLADDSSVLPISAFDNTEYESRLHTEWVPSPPELQAKGGTPAKAAWFDKEAEGAGTWKPCQVLSYSDVTKNTYLIQWGHNKEQVIISRLHLYFLAEDPFMYVRRLTEAYQLRDWVESMLRYNFLIDCMPTDDLPQLTNEQVNRMTESAVNTKPVLDKFMDTTHLIQEVNVEYARAMNKITFDYSMLWRRVPALLYILAPLQEEFIPEPRQIPPISGTVYIKPYGYLDLYSSFCFRTFLTKLEIISACTKVRAECNKVQNMHLFNTGLTKSLRLDDFVQAQHQFAELTATNLRESWVVTLKNHVRNSLKDVGKGWFNLDEGVQETYESGKLHKFLRMVKLMMEDSLRFLVENSLIRFTEFIESHCMMEVTITSTNETWSQAWNQWQAERGVRRIQLLLVELHFDQEGPGALFKYTTPLESLVAQSVAMFDYGITCSQMVPELEPLIMEKLFWSGNRVLNSVHLMEEQVGKLRTRIGQAMEHAVKGLRRYLGMYEPHLQLLRTDVANYAETLQKRRLTLEELVDEVRVQSKHLEHLEEVIPEFICVGPFLVNVKKLHDYLIDKKRNMMLTAREFLAAIPRAIVSDACKQYEDIHSTLRKRTTCIEEVAERRKMIEVLPETLSGLKAQASSTTMYYTALETVMHNLSDQDFTLLWTMLSWPAKVEKRFEDSSKILDYDTAKYKLEQESDQNDFGHLLQDLQDLVDNFHMHVDLDKRDALAAEAEQIDRRLQQGLEKATLFNSREELFKLPLTNYMVLHTMMETFTPMKQFWVVAASWRKWHQQWMFGAFNELDPVRIERDVSNAHLTLHKVGKVFIQRKLVVNATKCDKVRCEIEAFRNYVPLIVALRNPGMRPRHYTRLSDELGIAVRPTEDFTLEKALEMGLQNSIEVVARVCEVAGKEYALEESLDSMEAQWKDVAFGVLDYKETRTFIIKVEEAVVQQLDDHTVITQSMFFSPYKKFFEERISRWETTLHLASETIDTWLMLQRQWMYLEPIFSSPDIQQQLPIEAKRFSTVDRMWRKAMAVIKVKPAVLAFCTNRKQLENFEEGNRILDSVQKGLAVYLESKRLAFSRFFFLSNDELLQILSQTKNPLAVQPHLRKCFEAVDSLDFQQPRLTDKDYEGPKLLITAMNSAQGEKVPFDAVMAPEGNVESWLGLVESRMLSSTRHQTIQAMEAYATEPRKEWVCNWPAMVVLAVSAIMWTRGVEGAILDRKLHEFYKECSESLLDLTDLVRGELSVTERSTLGCVITVEVHARDVVEQMTKDRVSHLADFGWISQLRHYWEQGDKQEDVMAKMVQAIIPYGYEYLGNSSRLVITPLTDRCYMTLMGAMHLNLGGAPAGPAGTGKTETTKDLAKAVAKQCVVFNCSDGLDYLAMGKFFKGLASSGAWACFDEFNRIDLEVLSVVAQQILTIQTAIQQHLSTFYFEDTEIDLRQGCAVFITMNPGYAGRTELPDNLKALFRPCAMMVPDYALIAEISLNSFGFHNAKILATKMVATFKLCSEQLSSQDHYDYGMRAVKSVITAAGNLKRDYAHEAEEVLLLRGLRDVNVPKFLSHDLPLFLAITSDLFPGVEVPEVEYTDLLVQLEKVAREQRVCNVPAFQTKVIQLYETTIVRHGLMLVGPTGGGKTANYRCLQKAMSAASTYQNVRVVCMNPKAVTMGQLYGEFDENTHEWTDGVLACYMRDCADDTTDDKKWIMFDGPVDAIWIENMNTVLDDNKKLCLVSGEIIQMKPSMTMMFEVEDLAVASPATVSRCGMVYMEPRAIGNLPHLTIWLEDLPKCLHKYREMWRSAFTGMLEPAVRFARTRLKELVPSTDTNLVQSFFALLKCLLRYWVQKVEDANGDVQMIGTEAMDASMKPFFVLAMVWSVGASCNSEGRQQFDCWLREAGSKDKKMVEPDIPPAQRDVYSYCYVPKTGWQTWMSTVGNVPIQLDQSFAELMVPTMDTVRYSFLLEKLLDQSLNILCVGGTGTGKTLTVTNKLLKGMPEIVQPVMITFSARTSANQTQDLIESKLEKRRKGIYGPPSGHRAVLFVDDLNMPQREKYFAQPPIELLRQWMDHTGWYDRKPPCAFRQLIDIQFVGAMGPPGGGRNPMSQRFQRHFNVLTFVTISSESLERIFTSILGTFLETNSFSKPAQEANGRIVRGTVEIYHNICEVLLPTPAKSHYTFNLRDLAKVIQGLMRADPATMDRPEELVCLWLHEMLRVFQDRLVDSSDQTWFQGLVNKKLGEHFGVEYKEVVETDRLIYGDFMDSSQDTQVYAQIKDIPLLVSTITEYLEDYNTMSDKPMDLVLFLDAIEHIARVGRVIHLPLGNALLLGVGGTGRQSATKLATYMQDYDLFQIEITKAYSYLDWRENLKALVFTAGLDAKDITFLFTDSQIQMESFLEDLNNLLNTGEVPNLFNAEDHEKITLEMRPLLVQSGLPVTKQGLYTHFVNRVRNHLHMVLCFSPIGDAFRQRLRMFPSLVNCCTIDWFSDWSNDALTSVASSFLQKDFAKEKLGPIVKSMVHMHESASAHAKTFYQQLRRAIYISPSIFLELIQNFTSLVQEKRAEYEKLRERMQTGRDKLIKTAKDVEQMQKELQALQPVLATTAQEAEEMMQTITHDKAEAERTKEMVGEQEKTANLKAAEAKAIADDAQKDLDKALPALEEALSSLKNLSRNDIVEVKSMSNPPEGVKMVMEATCIMFDEKPVMRNNPGDVKRKIADYWEPAKKMLVDPNRFLESLMSYDKDNISDPIIRKIEAYYNLETFTPERVAHVSRACTSICMWVRAMYNYHFVNMALIPKRAALKEAQGQLDDTLEVLAQAQERLWEVEQSVATLERNHREAVQKLADLQQQVRDCQIKLARAEKLISGLGGERKRWNDTIQSLTESIGNVVGDMAVAAGTIAYAGPFTPDFRSTIYQEWRGALQHHELPHTPDCSLVSMLQDPVKVRAWHIAGLPSDNVSTENGIIVAKSRRWPIMIDPQGQANQWVRNMEQESGLEIIRLADPEYLRTLETGIRFGRAVLLEDLGEGLDTTLDPLLLKQLVKQAGSWHIKLSDSMVPYHQDFRFYMTTKLPNPHYPPEVSMKVSLLNFFVTHKGLADQLLGITVRQERVDLAEMKVHLVQMSAKLKAELKDMEDKILFMLSNSQGNILDDESLVETLARSKEMSNEISQKVSEAEVTEREIDQTRSMYDPVARHASLLFFIISSLTAADPMYQYSLTWFIELFVKSIGNSSKSTDVVQRANTLIEHFTYSLYANVCRSLFEKHKPMFSFMLCVKVLEQDGKIDMEEWRFLLAGGTSTLISLPNPAPSWLTEKSWLEILNMERLSNFGNFAGDFAKDIEFYKRIFDSNDAHLKPLHKPWNEKLNHFHRILFMRCLRPDKVIPATQEFITANLGKAFIEPPPFDLKMCFQDSAPLTPLTFVLSAGADPMADLIKLAEEMRFNKKFEKVSLGQGQGPKAERLLTQGTERGLWVCLQNCHLSTSWMPTLEQILQSLNASQVHKDFRLWLTAMPSPDFPVSILQNSIKMTLEPPSGLKANMLRSYSRVTDNTLAATQQPEAWRKLMFSISLFHAVIQDRRKFGPLGWNKMYDFTDGDLNVCLRQVQGFLSQGENAAIPYAVIRFLCAEINYGGRVTDEQDRRLIKTLLKNFVNPQVLQEGYKFSESGVYCSPEGKDVKGFVSVIKEFPVVPAPEIFGLHQNAEITGARNETFELFATVLSMQPRSSREGGNNGVSQRESQLLETCRDITSKVPAEFDVEVIGEKFPTTYSESMNTVLTQECIRFNSLLQVMKSTLKDSALALRGQVVMSPELEGVTHSIYTNQVPEIWSAKSYPSLKALSAWIEDLRERLDFIKKWTEEGSPKVYWVSGFFFPQAFLTGTLQNFARKYKHPIDTISFSFKVVEIFNEQDIPYVPTDGCYIRGLFLEGARWDLLGGCLTESRNKELYTKMPIIWLRPEHNRVPPTSGIYFCPVYKTLTRHGTLSTTGHSTNFILYMEVSTKEKASHWINRGVALFTSLQ